QLHYTHQPLHLNFSLQYPHPHRHLHSFPTRRSSDLGTGKEDAGTTDSAGRFRVIHLQPNVYSVTVNAPGFTPYKQDKVVVEVGRSEEHTSELQSRGHLVCRLLLEKKKTIRTTNTSNT